MVVLRPALPGELAKTCRCGHIGICSPIASRTSFYPIRKQRRYRSECRGCSVRNRTSRRAAGDPVEREWRRRAQRNFKERHPDRRKRQQRESAARRKAADPEGWAARQREAQRRYKARLRQDPARHLAALERDRINHRLRKERDEMAELPAVEDVRDHHDRKGPGLPVGPFRAWVERLLAAEEREARFLGSNHPGQDAKRRVADLLGVSVRTLYRYRFQLDEVPEALVDRACSRHGGVHILDIYPNLYDEVLVA